MKDLIEVPYANYLKIQAEANVQKNGGEMKMKVPIILARNVKRGPELLLISLLVFFVAIQGAAQNHAFTTSKMSGVNAGYIPAFTGNGNTTMLDVIVAGNIVLGTMSAISLPNVAAATLIAPSIIHDDDCSGDCDCLYTEVALRHWIDVGAVKVLAFIADSANNDSTPIMRIYNSY